MTADTTTNRGRRVTDKHGGILDAAVQAVQLKELEGDVKLLNQTLSGNIKALDNSINSLQIESRGIAAKIDGLVGLQAQHDTSREVLSEIRKSVGDLESKLERWVDDERRQRDEWQLRHEAENENNYRELQDRISGNRGDLDAKLESVRARVIWASGLGAGVVLIGGALISMGLWGVNYRFDETSKTQLQLATALSRLDDTTDEVDDRLREIEVYLARGGHNAAQPYNKQKGETDGDR